MLDEGPAAETDATTLNFIDLARLADMPDSSRSRQIGA